MNPFSLFLLSLFVFLVHAQTTDATRKEFEALQGQWTLEWGERNGEKVTFPARAIFTIKGNKYCFGDKEMIVLKIDPTCQPKLLDLTFVDPDDLAKGQTAEGIYRLDGDSMVWCWYTGEGVKQRPLDFKTERGSELVIYGFKRFTK